MVENTKDLASDGSVAVESEDNVKPDAVENHNGASRFSDDGMETEIEVTPEKPLPDEAAKKRRKRKKKRKKEAEKSKDAEEDAEEESDNDKRFADVPAEPLPKKKEERDEDVESGKTITKKRQLKKQVKKLRENRFFTLHVFVICMTSFVLPISIYACDVIIGVNVLEDADVGMDLVTSTKNLFDDFSAPLLSVADHDYTHRFKFTVLGQTQYLAKFRGRRQVLVESQSNSTSEYYVTTPKANTADQNSTVPSEQSLVANQSMTTKDPTSQFIPSQSASTEEPFGTSYKFPETTSQASTDLNASSYSTMFPEVNATVVNATVVNFTQTTFRYTEPSHQYCKHTIYFLEQHKELSMKASNTREVEYDWYNDMTSVLSKYQQALFFMFTVIGFVFLLVNMGLRVDAFLSEKWSSSLLVIFVLYTISMSLTAKVFALQSGANGVRCFLCRMVSYCEDINPWELHPDYYFPLEINWNTAAFVSIILKICDCFAIGILTLKYVLDIDNDPVWVYMLKVVSWLLIFPILVITPVTGVIAYSVLPVTVPLNLEIDLAMKIIFFIGVAFWAVVLLALPFFCKMHMCNDQEEGYDEEDEDY